MCHTRIMICVMSACLWMACHMTISALTVKTFRRTAQTAINDCETEVSAQSTLDCAIKCREYPHCISFAFDDEFSRCFLHPIMSSTGDSLKNLSVYWEVEPECSHLDINESVHSVTIRRSLWNVTANVTCNDDYFPPVLQVTCSGDGSWSDIQCAKRIWRYPETEKTTNNMAFKIPSTVTVNFSVCIEGNALQNADYVCFEIYTANGAEIPIHTAWRFSSSYKPSYLSINVFVNGVWGTETHVYLPSATMVAGQPFSFRLGVSSPTTVDIFNNGVFFARQAIQRPVSSFSTLNVYGDVNMTRVEAWCTG